MFADIKRRITDKISEFKMKKNYHKNKSGQAKSDTSKMVIFIIFFVLFIIQSFISVYPLFWCIMNSLKTNVDYLENMNGLPTVWMWEIWKDIVPSFTIIVRGGKRVTFWGMIFNSIWFAFGTQFMNVLASICVAYPLARYNFPGKGFLYGIIIFRITIPIIGTGSVGYKLERALGMIDNPVRYTLGAFQGFDMNALIMYGYFKAVSKEYSEAAFIDGAGPLKVLFSVVIPQAFPCVLALYVNSVMGQWNNYGAPLISLPSYPNLAFGIYMADQSSSFLGVNNKAKFFGAVLLSSAVPLLLFTIAQKTMINNMSVGGLKG